MTAVDTNILVYAHRADSSWYEPASSVITELAEGQSPWAIPWPCIYEFLAIVTHPRIYKPPTPMEDALVQVDRWLESPSVHLISEDDAFFEVVRPIVKASGVRGGAVHDARIEKEIQRRIVPLEGAVTLWQSIPGIEGVTACNLVAGIGVNMDQFPSAQHLASWAGSCPGNHESAGKRMSGKTRDGNKWLRRALCQAAWAARRPPARKTATCRPSSGGLPPAVT